MFEKSFKIPFLKHHGFSITELVVSLVILSGLTLITTNSFVSLKKSQTRTEQKNEKNILKTSLFNYILNTKFCNKEFDKYYLPSATSATLDARSQPIVPCTSAETLSYHECNLQFSNYKGYGDGSPIEKGADIPGTKLTLEVFKLARKQGVSYESIQDASGQVIKTIHPVRVYIGFKTIDKVLEVDQADFLVTVDTPTQKIETCQSLDLDRMCELMGGVWDGTRCKPESQCWLKGSFTTCSSTLNRYSYCQRINNPLTGGTNCESGITPTRAGRYVNTYTRYVHKKYKPSITDTYTTFLCLKCN